MNAAKEALPERQQQDRSGPPDDSPGRRAQYVILLLCGIGLLLPGLCSIAAISMLTGFVPRTMWIVFSTAGGLNLLWTASFAVSAAGIWLIYFALRKD
jgi:hypothetical protein